MEFVEKRLLHFDMELIVPLLLCSPLGIRALDHISKNGGYAHKDEQGLQENVSNLKSRD
jgi:hypothetical protein